MRISVCRLSRYVKARAKLKSHTIAKERLIAEAALRDSQRSWSRKTAEMLGIALRNDAHLEWNVLNRFAELPLHREDVDPLIPLLESRALQGSDTTAFTVIGDLAVQTQSVSQLSERFLVKWIKYVGHSDPYRAIQLWKTYLPGNKQVGCSLYLAAQQPHAAESLVETPVPNSLIRQFVEGYIAQNDTANAQRWIDRWQSPFPEDVSWLHDLSRRHGLDLVLPECAQLRIFPEPHLNVEPKLQSLTKRVNALLAAYPELLEVSDIKRCWQRAIFTPCSDSVNRLVELVSLQCSSEARSDTRWNGILRLTDSTTTLNILRTLRNSLSNRAFAVAISRSPSAEHLDEILKVIPPDYVCTELCLSAIARRAPTLLLELVAPPELMDITLKEHHLIALWSVNPPAETKQWLVPLTLRTLDSARLMRAALHSCVFQDDRETARALLRDFVVTRRLTLDRRIIEAPKDRKIPRPTPSSLSEPEAEHLVNDFMKQLFH